MLIPLIPKIIETLLVPRVSFLDFSEAIKQFQHFKLLANDLNSSFRFLPKKKRDYSFRRLILGFFKFVTFVRRLSYSKFNYHRIFDRSLSTLNTTNELILISCNGPVSKDREKLVCFYNSKISNAQLVLHEKWHNLCVWKNTENPLNAESVAWLGLILFYILLLFFTKNWGKSCKLFQTTQEARKEKQISDGFCVLVPMRSQVFVCLKDP